MNISQFKPVMKLLTVVMVSELLIMTGLQLLPESVQPELVNLLDVLLLGLITTAVAQLWIVRPLQEAREQDALFRCIAEYSHTGLIITDPAQDNAIIFTNDAFTEITGYSMDEVKGKDPRFLSEGIGFQPGQDKVVNALRDIKPVNVLLKNRRKDGTQFWNDMHLSPISIHGDKPRYWLALLHDVTETRALNLQVEHLVRAVEQAGDMICIFDQQGSIDFVNHAFTEQTGLDQEQLKGELIWRYWSDEKCSEQRVQDALKEHGQWSGRNQWSREKGDPYEAMTTITMVEGDDERMHIAVIRDMTEEIEMQNKLVHAQKMEAVGTLAGGIAHDFNNMLAAMMGNLYLLKKNMHENESAVRRIETIEEQGYRGADLIRQMLVFARNQKPDKHDFDLQLLGKETIKLLQTRTPENICLNTDIDPIKMMLHGDPSLLQSSLFNLVNNAIHAIEEVQQAEFSGVVNLSIHAVDMGSVLPEVRAALHAGDGEDIDQCVHIAVSDNGSGMDKNTQARIFEPYFTTKKQGKGTGLGMSMVMGCVEIHNGWIGLTSAPGKGSSFDVYLPMSCAGVESIAPHETEMHPGHGELILLADDNVTLCESMCEILEDAGYRVLMACDGKDALQQYMEQKDHVKMVILDCVMPKLGGVEVAEAIWLQSGRAVKIVLMTGYDLDDSLKQTGISGGHPLVLQKPWNMEQLNGVLKSMCESVR